MTENRQIQEHGASGFATPARRFQRRLAWRFSRLFACKRKASNPFSQSPQGLCEKGFINSTNFSLLNQWFVYFKKLNLSKKSDSKRNQSFNSPREFCLSKGHKLEAPVEQRSKVHPQKTRHISVDVDIANHLLK